MADRFEVRPETLRSGAAEFAKSSPDVEDALTTLRSTLAGLGQPWGDDDPGRAFAKGYEPNARALMDAIATMAEGLFTMGEGLAAMAGRYDRSDAASAIPGS